MPTRISLIEAMGLLPAKRAWREAKLAVLGDGSTPKSRFGLSTLRIFHPRYAVALWAGQKPEGRLVPIVNLYNYRRPPPELGWSVRVTDVRDFRGGKNTYDSHNGTDFAIPPGTDVVAAAPGRVIRVSSEFHRGGRKVLLDHGRGLVTSYNHLARPLVAPGAFVKRGERIALSGYSGIDAVLGFPWVPPHVHFNVWLNGRYVDPFTPADRAEPSLFRAPNAPTPARADERDDASYEPTEWDERAIDAVIAACRHEEMAGEIAGAPTLEQRAAAALLGLNYFPTRFDRAALGEGFSLYRRAFAREPRLDLPFSYEDYDGVIFLDR